MSLNFKEINKRKLWILQKKPDAICTKFPKLTEQNKQEIITRCKQIIKRMKIIVKPATDKDILRWGRLQVNYKHVLSLAETLSAIINYGVFLFQINNFQLNISRAIPLIHIYIINQIYNIANFNFFPLIYNIESNCIKYFTFLL